jgi:hypothetical protein
MRVMRKTKNKPIITNSISLDASSFALEDHIAISQVGNNIKISPPTSNCKTVNNSKYDKQVNIFDLVLNAPFVSKTVNESEVNMS